MVEMKKESRGSAYYFEGDIAANDTLIVALPDISVNKKCLRDIGWICSEDSVQVYGTISEHPEDSNALWMELSSKESVNGTVTGIKMENSSSNSCRAAIRAVYL